MANKIYVVLWGIFTFKNYGYILATTKGGSMADHRRGSANPSQYPELFAAQLHVAEERFQHPGQLSLRGGRVLDPYYLKFGVSDFDERRTDTPLHAQFALSRRLGLRPLCHGQQQADGDTLLNISDTVSVLGLGNLERWAVSVIARGLRRKHRKQLRAEQTELDALLETASVEGEQPWVAGDYGSGQRHGKKIFAAPLVRAVITQDEVPRVQPVVLGREGQEGYFPRVLMLLSPRVFLLRQAVEVA